jgi:hypothetical protein
MKRPTPVIIGSKLGQSRKKWRSVLERRQLFVSHIKSGPRAIVTLGDPVAVLAGVVFHRLTQHLRANDRALIKQKPMAPGTAPTSPFLHHFCPLPIGSILHLQRNNLLITTKEAFVHFFKNDIKILETHT